MIQKDKDLLLKDLCARVPYGVKAFVKNWSWVEYKSIESVCVVRYVYPQLNNVYATSESGSVHVILGHDDYDIKPYLFPLEGMTKEQESDLNLYLRLDKEPIMRSIKEVDWFNKNHFDYRGLIEKGLAIDATGLNIY